LNRRRHKPLASRQPQCYTPCHLPTHNAQVEPLSWELVRIWMPVNLLFVAMLATNFAALQLVGVGMVSVLKNL
jgi:hypothetical protein